MEIKSEKRLAFLIVIFSAVLGLVAAEVALRLSGFEFALYPTKLQFGWPDPVTLQNYYRADNELLWVPKDYPSRVANWKDKAPTVVFMGDSCTEFGRYDEYLRLIVAAASPRSDFTFVNVGVGGWSSYQGLQQLKRDVIPMRPRFITVYYGWNDHWASFGIEDKEIAPSPLLQPFEKVRIVQLVNKTGLTLKHKAEGQPQRRPERVSLADFKSNLAQIVRLARNNGIVPILITAPTSHQKGKEPGYLSRRWLNNLDELVPLHQEYVQAVRDISASEGAPLIDLHAEFGQMSRQALETYFMRDGIHLTQEGNRMIAEYIYGHFAKNNLYN